VGGDHGRSAGLVEQPDAGLPDLDGLAQHGAGGGGSHRHHHARLHRLELVVEPRVTGGDVPELGLLVDPSLSARLEVEVLDRVGEVDGTSVDAGLLEDERAVEHPPADYARSMDRRLALVRRPSPLLADGLVTHIERSPVDVDLAVRQWQGYVDALVDQWWPRVYRLCVARR
jgi:hypothetical protein